MFTRKLALTATLLTAAVGAHAGINKGPDDSGQWTQIADGVYQRIGLDGTVYRDSVGDAGARYELELWKAELAEQQFSGVASRETLQNLRTTIANIEAYLASSKPEVGPDTILTFAATPTVFCGFVAFQTADAWHFANPGGGPSGSTSSVTYLNVMANSAAPTANFTVMASINPGTGNVMVNGSGSLSYTSPDGAAFLLTKTTLNQGSSFSASYSTASTVSVPGCSGGFNQFSEFGPIN